MLYERQAAIIDPETGDCLNCTFVSPTAFIVKFAILAFLVVGFAAYFIGGYYHAKRRMRKGLPLLKYHRWMLPNHGRRQNPAYYYDVRPPYNPGMDPNGFYGSYNAPPAYSGEMPPIYQPADPTKNVKPQDIEMNAQANNGPPAGQSAAQPSQSQSGTLGQLNFLRR